MIYEETVAVTEQDRKKIFVRIICALAASYLLSGAYSALKLPYGGIARIAFLGIMVAAVYYAFRHGLIAYIYRIEDGKLLFVTNSGKFDKVLCEAEIAKVQYITKGTAASVEAISLNAAKSSGGRERYTCVYEDEKGKLCKLLFEPSESYLEKVKQLGIEVR